MTVNFNEIKHLDIYNCKYCNYSTKNKSDYMKHLKTKKHLTKIRIKIRIKKIETKKQVEHYACERCGREYKYRTGLSRHLRTCGNNENDKNVTVTTQQSQIINLQNLLEKL